MFEIGMLLYYLGQLLLSFVPICTLIGGMYIIANIKEKRAKRKKEQHGSNQQVS